MRWSDLKVFKRDLTNAGGMTEGYIFSYPL